MAATAAGGATGKWIVAAVVVLAAVALLVWAGTRTVIDAVQGSAIDPAALAYLSTHKDKPGVHTTASGLQYEVVSEGTGAKPTAADTVTVHYEGRLLDGTVFDSSIARGQPATFPLDRVIPGWTEGVALMPVGSTYLFTIPPDLGYGARGAGGVIPPNAVLVFEVRLLGIQGK